MGILSVLLLLLAACNGASGADSEDPPPAAEEADIQETTEEETAEEAATQDGSALGEDLGTVTPGVIKVAIQPYHPYTSFENGELLGLDSEVLLGIAEDLGYEVEVEVTDFAGMLAGVQSGRVDVSIGGIAWTEERQQEGLFTDPVYYSPPAMAVGNGEQYSMIAELEGLHLGTVEGYVWVESIQAIPGATLHAYPDATGVIDDLGAGRIDVGFLDPFLLTAAEIERPELGIKTQYLTPPTAEEIEAEPAYAFFAPYTVNFYVAPDATALEAALSEGIREMYANGEMAALIEEYGGDPEAFLVPYDGAGEMRQGIDRADDWQTPSV